MDTLQCCYIFCQYYCIGFTLWCVGVTLAIDYSCIAILVYCTKGDTCIGKVTLVITTIYHYVCNYHYNILLHVPLLLHSTITCTSNPTVYYYVYIYYYITIILLLYYTCYNLPLQHNYHYSKLPQVHRLPHVYNILYSLLIVCRSNTY